MRLLICLLTALLSANVTFAKDKLSGRFLSQVIETSKTHQKTMADLMKGHSDVASWVRRLDRRTDYISMGSRRHIVDEKPMELFSACNPRRCADSLVYVLYSADGTHAVMRAIDFRKGDVFVGDPNEAEKAVLMTPDG